MTATARVNTARLNISLKRSRSRLLSYRLPLYMAHHILITGGTGTEGCRHGLCIKNLFFFLMSFFDFLLISFSLLLFSQLFFLLFLLSLQRPFLQEPFWLLCAPCRSDHTSFYILKCQ